MTSTINYAAINTAYPVAGQDNNSQGFRDNFTAIAAALAEAKNELAALQTNAVVVADLGFSTFTGTNNLQGTTLFNGLYNQLNGLYYFAGTIPAAVNIDPNNGPVQKIILSGNATVAFTNWATTGACAVRLIIAGDQVGVWTPTFTTTSGGVIQYDTYFPSSFMIGGESVTSVSVTSAGTGYTSPATISFTSGSPLTGVVAPTATATYKIIGVTMTGGTGFAVNDTLVLKGYPTVMVTVASVSAGVIQTVTVSNGGSFAAPLASGSYRFSAATGAGTGEPTGTLTFGIAGITVSNGGKGYAVAPTVNITGGGGSAAAATAFIGSVNTTTNVKIIDAWTVNGGANVYIKYVGEY